VPEWESRLIPDFFPGHLDWEVLPPQNSCPFSWPNDDIPGKKELQLVSWLTNESDVGLGSSMEYQQNETSFSMHTVGEKKIFGYGSLLGEFFFNEDLLILRISNNFGEKIPQTLKISNNDRHRLGDTSQFLVQLGGVGVSFIDKKVEDAISIHLFKVKIGVMNKFKCTRNENPSLISSNNADPQEGFQQVAQSQSIELQITKLRTTIQHSDTRMEPIADCPDLGSFEYHVTEDDDFLSLALACKFTRYLKTNALVSIDKGECMVSPVAVNLAPKSISTLIRSALHHVHSSAYISDFLLMLHALPDTVQACKVFRTMQLQLVVMLPVLYKLTQVKEVPRVWNAKRTILLPHFV
jgi:hypothetical protein